MAFAEDHKSGSGGTTCSYGGTPNLRRGVDGEYSSPSAPSRRFHCAAPLLWATLLLGVTNTTMQNTHAFSITKFLKGGLFPKFKHTPSSSSMSRESTSGSDPSEQCTKVLDLVFVVDESASIGSKDFKKVRAFLVDFIEMLPISEKEVHVAAVAYGRHVRTLWDFSGKAATGQRTAVETVSKMHYASGSSTMTHSALDEARSMLMSGSGARQRVPKVIVLLTDGASTKRAKTLVSAKEAREVGIQVFVIGVGNADASECRLVCGCTTKHCPQFIRSSWSDLASQVIAMMDVVCKKLPKDAVCSAWSDWSTCSVSCGEGVRRKTRQQVSDPQPGDPPCDECPVLMGKTCEELGGLEITETCNRGECPVDAGCGYWGPWSMLSATCGTASQVRHRMEYNHPPPKGAGLFCEQQSPPVPYEETKIVELAPCPTETIGEWSEWSACDVTCGSGKRRRTRRRVIQVGTDTVAEEEEHEEETCNTTPCPVDATCGEFGEWSSCSRTCGGGTSVRRREPWLSNQQYGGRTCLQQHPDGPEQKRDCNPHPCPVNEELGDWLEWGPCSVTCGKGLARRYRMPSTVKAANGGLTVEEQIHAGLLQAELEEVKECIHFPCGPCTYPFGDWSKCQGTCGNGYRERHTAVKFDYPNAACSLPTYELESCTPAGCEEGAGGGGGGKEEEEEGGPAPGGVPPGTGGTTPGEGGQAEKEEKQGAPAAAIAGGVVGGAVLLGGIAAGAYYGMTGSSAAAQGPAQVDFTEEGPRETVEEEKEAMIGVDEESDMWSS